MAKRRHTSFPEDVPFKCEEVATPSSVSDKPRKLPQRSTRTRALLLKAAEEIFVSVGYEKAALADIAHTAGKTRGAIYSHFKDKEEIFLTLVENGATLTPLPVTRTVMFNNFTICIASQINFNSIESIRV